MVAYLLVGPSVFAQKDIPVNDYLAKAEAIQYDNVDSALFFAKAANQLAANAGDSVLYATTLNRLAVVYYISGDYDKSFAHFLFAKEIFERHDDSRGLAFSLNGVGLIYLSEKSYGQALAIWEHCLQENRKLNDTISISKNLINLSIVLEELERYEEGKAYLLQSMALLANRGEQVYTVMTKNRLGRISYLMEDHAMAKSYYLEVLGQLDTVNKWEKAYAYTGLAEVYYHLGHSAAAEEAGLKGFEFADQVGAYWDLARVTEILSRVFEQSGKYEKAVKFVRLNKMYSDSLYNETKDRQLAQLHLKLTKADNQNLQVENELAKQTASRRNYGLLFSTAGLMLLIGLLFSLRRNLRLTKKYSRDLEEKSRSIEFQKQEIQHQNQSLKEINQTKDKLLSIVAHDLRSPLHSILQILEMYREGYFEDNQKDEALDLLYSQVVKTGTMLDNILKWVNEQIDNIHPKFQVVYPGQEIEALISTYEFQAKSKCIDVRHKQPVPPPIWVDKGHFQVIIQNLLHNAIKFTPFGGQIDIFYTQDGTNVQIHLRDSGNGMDDAKLSIFNASENARITSNIGTANETGSGLGLMLVKQFVVNNQGAIQLLRDSGSGAEFVITFLKVERDA
ncbi:tetratricopeptide repeat-containing sensor histidine kinase [Lunatimonas salinarum]|uniref:ATP-binding protein n=1 Tax=Lunatimonas salinarum TaxID=1774590 RepID=UPI001ADF36A3|nr:tetratricopeptide repeat-containing sensor histidine kinase [Lunatimonas salinarum]